MLPAFHRLRLVRAVGAEFAILVGEALAARKPCIRARGAVFRPPPKCHLQRASNRFFLFQNERGAEIEPLESVGNGP
jgi:hypothetical protein